MSARRGLAGLSDVRKGQQLPRFERAPWRRKLAGLPSVVLRENGWPTWRRWLGSPDPRALARIRAWRSLQRAVESGSAGVAPLLPWRAAAGIFGESRVPWEHLNGLGDTAIIQGKVRNASGRISRATCTCPFGNLVKIDTLDDFECDISDVEGISASKSASISFKDIQEFGRYFNEYKQATVDGHGLNVMLRHQEIRIIHRPGADSFHLSMWDGRLFLGNHGGSHHFAGASYIAQRIGRSVPLRGRLHIRRLNVAAWQWLLTKFHVLFACSKTLQWAAADFAELVDAFYALDLPPRVGDGRLLLFPREHEASAALSDLLCERAARDVSHELHALLATQDEVRLGLAERWPSIALLANP